MLALARDGKRILARNQETDDSHCFALGYLLSPSRCASPPRRGCDSTRSSVLAPGRYRMRRCNERETTRVSGKSRVRVFFFFLFAARQRVSHGDRRDERQQRYVPWERRGSVVPCANPRLRSDGGSVITWRLARFAWFALARGSDTDRS